MQPSKRKRGNAASAVHPPTKAHRTRTEETHEQARLRGALRFLGRKKKLTLNVGVPFRKSKGSDLGTYYKHSQPFLHGEDWHITIPLQFVKNKNRI